MATWLIGEAPTKHSSIPFTGRSGKFLQEVSGINLHRVFLVTNLLKEHPGKKGKGSDFPLSEARQAAKHFMVTMVDPSDRLIVVGARAARAFRIRKSVTKFTWVTISLGTTLTMPKEFRELEGVEVSWIPHPSGVNRWWNDKEHKHQARKFLRHAAADALLALERDDS